MIGWIIIGVLWLGIMILKFRQGYKRELQIKTKREKYPNLNDHRLVGTKKYPY